MSVKRTWTTNKKAACRRFIQVEVVIEEEVIQYMSDFVEHNENNPLSALMFLLMTKKKIQATNNDQELHLVNLSPAMRNIFIKGGARVHPGGE